ncbi:MAG TPA: ATP-binding protein [Holophagaceae bacterium]|nr:ATP-binding protein [Holophagaceae bacterium]HJW33079.1 ATP-binding protein [Holophagaceae bacterium]
MTPEGILTLSWLIRLRWAALAVYAGLLALAVLAMDLDIPLGLCGSLLLVVATTNLCLLAWWDASGPGPRGLTGAVLVLDTLVFGGLLYATGGPANPCSALFLVHVALAASVLGLRWGWAMALLVAVVDGLLFPFHLPLGHLDHQMAGMAWHLAGMWAGLALTAILVAHFVGRLSEALGRERARAESLQVRADREARLAAVTALAAGAAHELATPLGTIALAASDLDPADPRALAADVALIQREVDRCRGILDTLAYEGGQLTAEAPQTLDLGTWIRTLAEGFGPRLYVEAEDLRAHLPARSLALVLRGLVKNAREAAGTEAFIQLRVGMEPTGELRIRVIDLGPGFPPELLPRVGEAFLSTKGEEGMGLGLFLARGWTERLGGHLVVESRPGLTQVALHLPAEVLR